MRVLFFGEEISSNFIKEYYSEKGEDAEITCTGKIPRISADAVISQNQYTNIVIDVSMLVDEVNDVVKNLLIISRAGRGANHIIIYAPGFSPVSDMIIKLTESDGCFTKFILSKDLAGQKMDWHKCITGQSISPIANMQLPTVIARKTEDKPKPTAPVYRGTQSIAVVGACNRIGTTTQALQIVKCLQYKGYTAAYIETNNTRYVENLKVVYESMIDVDLQMGRVTYSGVDMYNKPEYIGRIRSLYDFLVYDCGVFQDEQKHSYFDKDYCVVVCGFSPSEAGATSNTVKKTMYNDTYFIFSFCAPDEEDGINDLMDDRAGRTGFAGYTPDPFMFSTSNKLYSSIFTVNDKKEKKGGKRGWSFLKK